MGPQARAPVFGLLLGRVVRHHRMEYQASQAEGLIPSVSLEPLFWELPYGFFVTLGLQIAQNRSYSHTLGPKVGIFIGLDP